LRACSNVTPQTRQVGQASAAGPIRASMRLHAPGAVSARIGFASAMPRARTPHRSGAGVAAQRSCTLLRSPPPTMADLIGHPWRWIRSSWRRWQLRPTVGVPVRPVVSEREQIGRRAGPSGRRAHNSAMGVWSPLPGKCSQSSLQPHPKAVPEGTSKFKRMVGGPGFEPGASRSRTVAAAVRLVPVGPRLYRSEFAAPSRGHRPSLDVPGRRSVFVPSLVPRETEHPALAESQSLIDSAPVIRAQRTSPGGEGRLSVSPPGPTRRSACLKPTPITGS
jgi:hypothetical protein